jgi:SAM-dependent methyltransferase
VALAPSVAEYRATDLSPKMVEIGRARPEGARLAHLAFDVARARQALEGGPWDAVLAFNLLHLLDDLPGALAQVREALVPGGRLISKTPCLADLGLWLRVVVPAMQLVGKAPPVRFVSAKGLERDIAKAGLEIVETGDYPAARAQRLVIARRPG